MVNVFVVNELNCRKVAFSPPCAEVPEMLQHGNGCFKDESAGCGKFIFAKCRA